MYVEIYGGFSTRLLGWLCVCVCVCLCACMCVCGLDKNAVCGLDKNAVCDVALF